MSRAARLLVVSLCLAASPAAAAATPQDEPRPAEIGIAAERHVLPNGLTLVVHEDHDAPAVAVCLWYHVGSKDEGPGQTGFAHLVEHLMFQGSQGSPGDYFGMLEELGAIDVNATADRDRTAFFQTVPANALDLVLWLEADRMASFPAVLDRERIDEQVRVIANEKRHQETRPFGSIPALLAQGSYPADHPYSRPTLGPLDDLSSASVEDVGAWYRAHYGAANATLVVAGDVEPDAIRRKVEKWFGGLPAGPTVRRHERWIAPAAEERRESSWGAWPATRVYKVWNVPERGTPAADHLAVAAEVLGSRLQRLVDEGLAVDADATFYPGEIGSQLIVHATARSGIDLARVEEALDHELETLAREGPSGRELLRIDGQRLGDLLRRIDSVGCGDGKGALLAESSVFGGGLDAWEVSLRRALDATPQRVQQAVAEWLSGRAYVLEAHPRPASVAAGPAAVPDGPPPVGPPLLPDIDVRTRALANGLRLVVAERPGSPLTELRVVVELEPGGGTGAAAGLPDLLLHMLWLSTAERSDDENAAALLLLGAQAEVRSSLDALEISLSVPPGGAEEALALLAGLVRKPSYPTARLESFKHRVLARIRREESSPPDLAMRLMPVLLYGPGHPYAAPFSGSGTAASVSAISSHDLVRAHRAWFQPGRTTLVAVGDTRLERLLPHVERLFSDWQEGPTPGGDEVAAARPAAPGIYLVDVPGAPQSTIMAGQSAPARTTPRGDAVEILSTVLAGTPGGRLPGVLRHEKGWAYGVYSILLEARGPRPLMLYSQVQTDATGPALAAMARELEAIVGPRPITATELTRAQRLLTFALPARLEKRDEVAEVLARQARLGLPDDDYRTSADRIGSLGIEEVRAAVRDVLRPEELIWLVIGDRAVVEPQLLGLGLGTLRHLAPDGSPIEPPPLPGGPPGASEQARRSPPAELRVEEFGTATISPP